jgi:hypothetical protein
MGATKRREPRLWACCLTRLSELMSVVSHVSVCGHGTSDDRGRNVGYAREIIPRVNE